MTGTVIICLLLPFLGTALGACSVIFARKNTGGGSVDRVLAGFAAGVMTAASVWSLLIPALESANGGFVPAACGFAAGIAVLYVVGGAVKDAGNAPPAGTRRKSTAMLVFAVTLHNFPEGLAVGAAAAGLIGGADLSEAAVTALAAGIAIQNIPEGSIISLPLYAAGKSKAGALAGGLLSGAAELAGALVTLAAAHFITPLLPFLLSFAAGAMIFVVIEELVPEFAGGGARYGTAVFAAGFLVMMALDVVFG